MFLGVAESSKHLLQQRHCYRSDTTCTLDMCGSGSVHRLRGLPVPCNDVGGVKWRNGIRSWGPRWGPRWGTVCVTSRQDGPDYPTQPDFNGKSSQHLARVWT